MPSSPLRAAFAALSLTALTALGLSAALPATAQTYTVQDLGVLEAGGSTSGIAVNSSGQTTGSSRRPGTSTGTGFFYDGTQMFALPTLGGTSGEGRAISDTGAVVGVSRTSAGVSHAVRWHNGTIQNLTGKSTGVATGINNAASPQIVGYFVPGVYTHAFAWQSGTIRDLGVLKGGRHSWATAINDLGQIVGESESTTQRYPRAVLWESGVPMRDLGVLAGTQSRAADINNVGQIVGYSHTNLFNANGTRLSHAVLWERQANGSYSIRDLGSLSETSSSGAFSINDAGRIIGSSGNKPFVWDGQNRMRDLNSLLDPATSAGWVILNVRDINNVGQIVGDARYNGESDTHAVLLTPVPPPTAP